MEDTLTLIKEYFSSSANLISNSTNLSQQIDESIQIITEAINENKKILIFGNGGSAADAQHIVAELVGKFNNVRRPLPAISLTTDTSILTSISNDFSFNDIFLRQCEALILPGDVVIGISTSGKSLNVINGINTAKRLGAKTIGLLGNNGGKLKNIVDLPIIVNSSSTPKIQEVHRVIYHIICENVEKNFSG